jgi:hypothetical protein
MRKILALALLVTLAACGDDKPTQPAAATATGTWAGTIEGQQLTLTLVQNGGAVSGTGTMSNTPSGTRALTATGTFTAPNLTLTLSSGTAAPMALQGAVSGNALTATLSGSGWTGEAITMQRN